MKWLFFVLLLINIGMFVWIYPQTSPTESENSQRSGINELVLLREIGQSEVDHQWVDDSEGDSVSGVGQPAIADHNLAKGKEYAAGQTGTKEKSSNNNGLDRVSPGSEIGPLAQEESKPIADETIPDDSIVTAKNNLEPKSNKQTISDRQCKRIGPFEKHQEADQLAMNLMGMDVQTELKTVITDEQEGYWVLIPPQKDRATAIDIVNRLRAAGISDLWRFTNGSLANAISLGLFRNISRAEIRRKAIAEKGFDPEVRPRFRQQTSYWLGFSYMGTTPIPVERWREIIDLYPEIEQITVDCTEADKEVTADSY